MAELLGALAAAYFFHWLSEGTVMLSKAKKVDYTGWDKVAEPTLSLVHSTANVRFGSLADIDKGYQGCPLCPRKRTCGEPAQKGGSGALSGALFHKSDAIAGYFAGTQCISALPRTD